MSELRSTIQLNEYTLCVLEKAEALWPELSGNRSAIIRKIAADWDRLRNETGGRSTQVIKRLDEHEKKLTNLEDELAEMKLMLRQLLGENNAPNY